MLALDLDMQSRDVGEKIKSPAPGRTLPSAGEGCGDLERGLFRCSGLYSLK